MLMITAGKINSCGVVSMVLMPSFDIDPQEGVGGTTPIPIKDRKASVKIALGIANVNVTSTTPRVLGIMWRKIK